MNDGESENFKRMELVLTFGMILLFWKIFNGFETTIGVSPTTISYIDTCFFTFIIVGIMYMLIDDLKYKIYKIGSDRDKIKLDRDKIKLDCDKIQSKLNEFVNNRYNNDNQFTGYNVNNH